MEAGRCRAAPSLKEAPPACPPNLVTHERAGNSNVKTSAVDKEWHRQAAGRWAPPGRRHTEAHLNAAAQIGSGTALTRPAATRAQGRLSNSAGHAHVRSARALYEGLGSGPPWQPQAREYTRSATQAQTASYVNAKPVHRVAVAFRGLWAFLISRHAADHAGSDVQLPAEEGVSSFCSEMPVPSPLRAAGPPTPHLHVISHVTMNTLVMSMLPRTP